MNSPLERHEVFDAALELSIYDRSQLAGLLYDSLPDEAAVEDAIGEEAHRRWLELVNGEAEGITGEEVIAQLHARLDRTSRSLDEILPGFSLKGGVRGKYADRYRSDAVVILLDPDVAEVFPDAESVNRALRALAQIIKDQAAGTPA